MAIPIKQITNSISASICGDESLVVTDVAALSDASSSQISYVESSKQVKAALESQAGALITIAEVASELQERGSKATFLVVKEPQVAFIDVMLLFRPEKPTPKIGISPKAVIADSAQIGAGCQIFPLAYIGENVQLGANCEVGPGVVIHDDCVIGDNCVIHANSVLYSHTQLCDRVIVHANAVIGADGFGYRFAKGQFIRIPHTGKVILESDVEIGAGTTVDRAMIGATVIGQGTKLDNQVQVAHNCRVGKHNVFASQVGMAGSSSTGDYVQMGGQVGVADHVKIGDGAKFGGKSAVVYDMPGGNSYLGSPAIDVKESIRCQLSLPKLPEMRQQIKQLTQQLAALQKQVEQQTSSQAISSAA